MPVCVDEKGEKVWHDPLLRELVLYKLYRESELSDLAPL